MTNTLARMMPERELMTNVVQLARCLNWRVYHTWNSIHSPAGFPDIIAMKAGRLLAVELKSETGTVSLAQQTWLDGLQECLGVEVYVWRPTNWLSGEVERVLLVRQEE